MLATILRRAKFFVKSLAIMLGKEPDGKLSENEYSEEAKKIHKFKKTPEQKAMRKEMIAEERNLKKTYKWKIRRWITLIFLNVLFIISYKYDVQLVEGSLTASRVLGFHFADLNSALQVMVAHKHIVINLIIGTVTVFILWWMFGGRSFCAWACPYHLLSEIGEILHLKLRKKRLVREHELHRGIRTALYIAFLALAFITGYTVYEAISPTGIVSRALIYGSSLAMLWVLGILLFEIFISRRGWCRYICPIGMTYGFVGAISPVGVTYNLEPCLHEGECLKVCLVPHVLQCVKIGHAHDVTINIGADCTRCGMCVDACPTGALKFKVKIIDDLI